MSGPLDRYLPLRRHPIQVYNPAGTICMCVQSASCFAPAYYVGTVHCLSAWPRLNSRRRADRLGLTPRRGLAWSQLSSRMTTLPRARVIRGAVCTTPEGTSPLAMPTRKTGGFKFGRLARSAKDGTVTVTRRPSLGAWHGEGWTSQLYLQSYLGYLGPYPLTKDRSGRMTVMMHDLAPTPPAPPRFRHGLE